MPRKLRSYQEPARTIRKIKILPGAPGAPGGLQDLGTPTKC